MKFYEKRDFRRLRAEWYDKLKADGFYDLEGGRDGEFLEAEHDTDDLVSIDGWRGKNGRNTPRDSGGSTEFELAADRIEAGAAETAESLHGIMDRAKEALARVEVWKGLGKDARRWWALQVYCGWTPRRAAEHLGHNWRWIAKVSPEVKARIAR